MSITTTNTDAQSNQHTQPSTPTPQPKDWKKSKITKWVGVGVSTILALSLMYFLFLVPSPKPMNVRVTNITDRSATISWVSEEATKGTVTYGETEGFAPWIFARIGKDVAYDDRDVHNAEMDAAKEERENIEKLEGAEIDYSEVQEDVVVRKVGKYFVHHVTVSGLDPDKDYFFRVGNEVKFSSAQNLEYSDGDEVSDKFEMVERFQFKTLPDIEDVPSPDPIYGMTYIGPETDFPADDAMIYVKLRCGLREYPAYLSATTNDTGGWYIDLANAREENGEVLSGLDEDICQEDFFIDGGAFGYTEVMSNPMTEDAPMGNVHIVDEDEKSSSSTNDRFIQSVSAKVDKGTGSDSTSKTRTKTVSKPSTSKPSPKNRNSQPGGEPSAKSSGSGKRNKTVGQEPKSKSKKPSQKKTSGPTKSTAPSGSVPHVVRAAGTCGKTCCCSDNGDCGNTTDLRQSDGSCLQCEGTRFTQKSSAPTTDCSTESAVNIVCECSDGTEIICIRTTPEKCAELLGTVNRDCTPRRIGPGAQEPVEEGQEGTPVSSPVESEPSPEEQGYPLEEGISKVAGTGAAAITAGLSIIAGCGAGAGLGSIAGPAGTFVGGVAGCIFGGGIAGISAGTISDQVESNVYDLLVPLSEESNSGLFMVYATDGDVITEEYIIIPKVGKYAVEFGGYISQEFVTFEDGVKVGFFIDSNANGVYDEGDEMVTPEGYSVEVESQAKLYKYNLLEGFNFISFPFVIDAGFENNSASELLNHLNGLEETNVYSIAKFESGRWIVMENRDGEDYGSDDFQIIPGKGYVIKVGHDMGLVISGKKIVSPTAVYFNTGWNLIGVHGTDKEFTAESLIDQIDADEAFDADNVTKWNFNTAKYEGLQKEAGTSGEMQVYGFDYTIYDSAGYFVRIDEGQGNWLPE